MITLLDVNVLISILDGAHEFHLSAHDWFGTSAGEGWATCAITVNGCVRVMTSARYPGLNVTPGDVLVALTRLCDRSDHTHWDCTAKLTDWTLFRPSLVSSKQVTDVYLLGLAVKNGGRLATFDRRIPLDVVIGASKEHLLLL